MTAGPSATAAPGPAPGRLSLAWKRHLRRDGYLVVPDIVPLSLADRALRAINASLDRDGLDPDWLPVMKARSFAPGLRRDPAVTGLVTRSGLWPILAGLIGAGKVHDPEPATITLRFPQRRSATTLHPRIEGLDAVGRVENFTARLLIPLSDMTAADVGNPVVWPGTHRQYGEYFERHGAQALAAGLPEVNLPEPRQIRLHRGDALLLHYLCGHATAPNLSPRIAYWVGFDIHHVDHESTFWNDFLHWHPLTDIWSEWPGLAEVDDGPQEF